MLRQHQFSRWRLATRQPFCSHVSATAWAWLTKMPLRMLQVVGSAMPAAFRVAIALVIPLVQSVVIVLPVEAIAPAVSVRNTICQQVK